MALTEIPIELSSTPGIVDNSNATAITIDSSENVGIGTSAMSSYYAKDLVIAAADEGGITIECAPTEKSYLMFADGTSGAAQYAGYIGYDHAVDSLNVVSYGYTNFYTGPSQTEAMRIDSSGNVGIGTSTLGSVLSIEDTADKAYITQTNSQSAQTLKIGNAYSILGTTLGSYGAIDADAGLLLGTAATERMRIDASGNLLVGKTGLDVSVAGAEIRPNLTAITSAGDTPLFLRRNTNDGELVNFKKDGATVGSIGTVAGRLGIGTGDAGLFFDDVNNRIGPVTMASGTPVDSNGLLDLGYSGARFKDLYLAGGVVFGDAGGSGTSSSNTLDSYEEGTWVIGLTFGGANVGMTTSATDGAYTKVGNLVTCTGYFALSAKGSSTGDAVITGLPFTVSSINGGYSALSIRNIRISFADMLEGNTVKAGTSIVFTESTNAGASSVITDGNFANDSGFIMSVTYRTD